MAWTGSSSIKGGLARPFSPSVINQPSERKQLTTHGPFSATLSNKIGLVYRVNPKQSRAWYLKLLWWDYEILRYILQRTFESTTRYDWTASKFASHSHKGVKCRRGLPFYSRTSWLRVWFLDIYNYGTYMFAIAECLMLVTAYDHVNLDSLFRGLCLPNYSMQKRSWTYGNSSSVLFYP